MNAPWNVRVQRYWHGYFKAEARVRGEWYAAGSAKTWLDAFIGGLLA